MDISGLGFGSALSIGDRGKPRDGEAALFAGLVGGAGAGASAKDEALKLLGEMTEGGLEGYWKWMIKTMRERLRAEVMDGMGISEEQLNAMPADQRRDTEARITEEVERRLKAWVEQQMTKHQDIAEQRKLEQTMAAMGVAAEMQDPEAKAEGTDKGDPSLLPWDGGMKSAKSAVSALPMTAEALRAAGYQHDDIVRRIVEGRLHDDERGTVAS